MGRPKKKLDEDIEHAELNPQSPIDGFFEELFTEGMCANTPSEIEDGQESLWVKSRGWTPLEYLTFTFRNPWQKTSDRIAAAKAVMDYVHKKLPQKIEVDGQVTETKKITAGNLGKLSDKELELFTQLLEKLGD